MDKSEIRAEARDYFLPFLLGSNSNSRRLARKIYRKYKITCYILDTEKTFFDVASRSRKFVKLTKTKSQSVMLEEILYLAAQCPYTLPILIPCSEEYESLVNENREALEAKFVLSSQSDALIKSPLSVIP